MIPSSSSLMISDEKRTIRLTAWAKMMANSKISLRRKKISLPNGSQWQRKISNRLLILILFPFLSTVHFMQIDTLGWAAIERGWVWGEEKVMAMAFYLLFRINHPNTWCQDILFFHSNVFSLLLHLMLVGWQFKWSILGTLPEKRNHFASVIYTLIIRYSTFFCLERKIKMARWRNPYYIISFAFVFIYCLTGHPLERLPTATFN